MIKLNRKFAKLKEDGALDYAPIPLPINGNTWTNSKEIHLECGYYPVQHTDRPIKEGYTYKSYWEVVDNILTQKWEEHKVEPIEVAQEEDVIE